MVANSPWTHYNEYKQDVYADGQCCTSHAPYHNYEVTVIHYYSHYHHTSKSQMRYLVKIVGEQIKSWFIQALISDKIQILSWEVIEFDDGLENGN